MEKNQLANFTPGYLGSDYAIASIEDDHAHFYPSFVWLYTVVNRLCIHIFTNSLIDSKEMVCGEPFQIVEKVSCLSCFMTIPVEIMWDKVFRVQPGWKAWKKWILHTRIPP